MFASLQLLLLRTPLFFGKAYASCSADQNDSSFFGLPKWYKYLPYNTNTITNRCEITVTGIGHINQYWLIGLALLDMVLHIAGIVAVVFVIWGGFTYLTSRGEPEKTAEARKTILNALIGAIIAIMAVAIVGFVGNTLRGT